MGFLFMKNNFKIISVIIGTLIGAGFASGQEIYLFFFNYGINRYNWNSYIFDNNGYYYL